MAGKKIIIFGCGQLGIDAYYFFGADNIEFYVDNYFELCDKKDMFGKEVLTAEKLEFFYRNLSDSFYEKYEVVISSARTVWATYSIVCQLAKMGISKYNVYVDIKKRWKSGIEFLERDTSVFPCERESILHIYEKQREYLIRHIHAADLLPAVGELRKKQLAAVNRMKEFKDYLSANNVDIPLFMIAGTLLGALRHKGFIPWDDDLDFGLMYSECVRLMEFMDRQDCLFVHQGNNIWKNNKGELSVDKKHQYICAWGYGYLQIYENIGESYIKDNIFVTDIFPVYYYNDSVTDTDFMEKALYWVKRRVKNFDEVDRVYYDEVMNENTIVSSTSNRVGYGFDLISFIYIQWIDKGMRYTKKIWDTNHLLPLKECSFEGESFLIPHDEIQWLKNEGYANYMMLPDRVGVLVHDKDRIFTEQY